jgi:RNA polymerase sigma-70 factor (ECF subfamily)
VGSELIVTGKLQALEKYTDIEIIAFIREGNVLAFQELYLRYWKELFYAASRKIGRKEDAGDVIQEIFTELWFRKEKLHVHDSVSGYLHTILKFKIFDFYHQASRQETHSLAVVPEEEVMEESTASMLHVKELQEIVDEEVKNLPGRMREIFVMSREQGMTAEEIAQTLSISVQTVRNQLSTSLKKIRFTLSQHYGGFN